MSEVEQQEYEAKDLGIEPGVLSRFAAQAGQGFKPRLTQFFLQIAQIIVRERDRAAGQETVLTCRAQDKGIGYWRQ